MGVTGSGKTTIGTLLAQHLRWTFLDADDFHSAANKAKMHAGIPLDDADRAPWLAAMHSELVRRNAAGENVVLACSALKQTYRDQLSQNLSVKVIYLRGTYDEMKHHIETRMGHFAGTGILAGQFADLEEPLDAIVEDVGHTPEEIVKEVLRKLNLA